ncbi:YidB family protein [Roseateles violae]|uniref:YidB family protein n=1 Tax=Roseateles violae TaxID=3058042 RepID=A0ABT8DPK6_9BURK|nr:YidB family protein [Pelomonas sp. PFR6]MDN3919941.1 YidB family protein [Pelomonas sp. PFR6]
MGLLDSLLGAAQQAMGGQTAQQGMPQGQGGGVDWAGLIMTLLVNSRGGAASGFGQGGLGSLGAQGGLGAAAGLGGLGGLLQQLQAGGLGEQVQSWVSTGANQPVSGDQLSAALGMDVIGDLAQQAGVSQAEASHQLSRLLPEVVDRLSPQGQLPHEDDLGGLLGQLLGR